MAPDINTLPQSGFPTSAAQVTTSPVASMVPPTAPTSTSTTTPLSTPPATEPPPPAASRPNILYIMADQLAAPLLKIHDPSSVIKTPHLDSLAARSVQFDSAYCASPLCAPSRMSMMTGLLPIRIGAYDNASQIMSDLPTFAHYMRAEGYHTALAGKMHFVGDQLHGFEDRLTSDIYPGDFGWAVNWDEPDARLEWYHNASSVLQAGVCIRSNQLDYDEEVMYRSTQYLYDHVRAGPDARPFCLTVSLTHPHDPYAVEQKYWDRYEGVEIPLPNVRIPKEDLDPHSKRLMRVCELWDQDFTDDQIRAARRAYYGAVSFVDDCIGRLLEVLRHCRLDKNTIVVFAGDHGDMLGERGLWYKMTYFENSARVPLLVHDPRGGARGIKPHRVKENVSTLDLLPTLVDLVGGKLAPGLPMDGTSLLPHLRGTGGGSDTVIGEYTGEGTIQPLMMIRRGKWKFVICPADGEQLFDLEKDPLELVDWARKVRATMEQDQDQRQDQDQEAGKGLAADIEEARRALEAFKAEAAARWDFKAIRQEVLLSQRRRRFVWSTLRIGRFESWDHNPTYDDGRVKYIRSHIPLADLERRARYPAVDMNGREFVATRS